MNDHINYLLFILLYFISFQEHQTKIILKNIFFNILISFKIKDAYLNNN